jgi:sec-independent protein translocase protein TatA
MHPPSIWAIIIVLVLVVILFGKPGRLSGFMEDLGKGIKGFRKGVGDAETPPTPTEPPPRQVQDQGRTPDPASTNQDRAQG